MDLRVTTQTATNMFGNSIQQETSQLGLLEQQASTGLRINQPSDDPVGEIQLLAAKTQDSQLSTYLTNISSAQNVLNQSNSTATQVNDLLTQATQLAIQGINGGNSQTTFSALGSQANSILTQLVNLGNTQQDGQYIFSGTAVNTKPFVLTTGNNGTQTVAYQGSAQTGQVPVGDNQTVATLYSGSTVFQQGQGNSDVFQAVIGLRDALNNTGGLSSTAQATAISQAMTNLQQASTGVLQVVGQQGADLANLNALQTGAQNLQTQTQAQEGNLGSADLSKLVVQLQSQQNLLQLTLAASSQIYNQSLLNYIK